MTPPFCVVVWTMEVVVSDHDDGREGEGSSNGRQREHETMKTFRLSSVICRYWTRLVLLSNRKVSELFCCQCSDNNQVSVQCSDANFFRYISCGLLPSY